MRKALEGDEALEDTCLGKTSSGFHSRVLLKERLDPPHRERHVHVRTAEITFTLRHRMFCTKKEMFPSWKMHLVGIDILQLNSSFVRGFSKAIIASHYIYLVVFKLFDAKEPQMWWWWSPCEGPTS